MCQRSGEFEELMFLAAHAEAAVLSIVEKYKDDERWAGKHGGYFIIADGKTGLALLVVAIGDLPLEKAPKRFVFSQEKACRLALWPTDESSYRTRNPEKNRWGGAIRFRDKILSFSGLPEHGDEAAMLNTGCMADQGFLEAAARIAALSNNPYWENQAA